MLLSMANNHQLDHLAGGTTHIFRQPQKLGYMSEAQQVKEPAHNEGLNTEYVGAELARRKARGRVRPYVHNAPQAGRVVDALSLGMIGGPNIIDCNLVSQQAQNLSTQWLEAVLCVRVTIMARPPGWALPVERHANANASGCQSHCGKGLIRVAATCGVEHLRHEEVAGAVCGRQVGNPASASEQYFVPLEDKRIRILHMSPARLAATRD